MNDLQGFINYCVVNYLCYDVRFAIIEIPHNRQLIRFKLIHEERIVIDLVIFSELKLSSILMLNSHAVFFQSSTLMTRASGAILVILVILGLFSLCVQTLD